VRELLIRISIPEQVTVMEYIRNFLLFVSLSMDFGFDPKLSFVI